MTKKVRKLPKKIWEFGMQMVRGRGVELGSLDIQALIKRQFEALQIFQNVGRLNLL